MTHSETGHLAVAIEDVVAGEDRLDADVALMRLDDRHPGPHRSLADTQRTVARDERGVPDPHPGDVGDGVVAPRRHPPNRNAEVTQSDARFGDSRFSHEISLFRDGKDKSSES